MQAKTPIGKLEELPEGSHPFQEKEPLKPFPGGINPKTGDGEFYMSLTNIGKNTWPSKIN